MAAMESFDMMDERTQKLLHYFAIDTTKKILKNFQLLEISSPYHPKKKPFTGNLYRSIYWQVQNNAGGNQTAVRFYFLNYARYLEMGVGWGVKYSRIPAITAELGLRPIPRDGGRRMAKPFLMSEIRLHTRMVLEKLAAKYAFEGGMYILSTLADKNAPTKESLQSGDWYQLMKQQAAKEGIVL